MPFLAREGAWRDVSRCDSLAHTQALERSTRSPALLCVVEMNINSGLDNVMLNLHVEGVGVVQVYIPSMSMQIHQETHQIYSFGAISPVGIVKGKKHVELQVNLNAQSVDELVHGFSMLAIGLPKGSPSSNKIVVDLSHSNPAVSRKYNLEGYGDGSDSPE